MRAIAITPPGMFLSQPPTTSTPSIAWPLTEVSIASAITSRDTSEYFIASLATPTIGLSKSPSPKPTARSMARFGERATPWVMRRERRLAGVVAMGTPPGGAIVAPRAAAGQCNCDAAVILFRYGSAGFMAVAVFHGRGRAPPFQPRGGGAAHLAAAA